MQVLEVDRLLVGKAMAYTEVLIATLHQLCAIASPDSVVRQVNRQLEAEGAPVRLAAASAIVAPPAGGLS